jgi:transcriptional regulator with XRE-family HTH domain
MSASIEILTPEKNAKLERDIGAARAAHFVTTVSANANEPMLITSLSDLNDPRRRQLLEAMVQQLADRARRVPWVVIETESVPPLRSEALQALVQLTAQLARVPYVTSALPVVRRMILAHKSKSERELIASASISGGKLVVWTCEPQRLEAPVDAIPSLARMNPSSLSRFVVSESGSRIHWPDEDVDLTAESIRAFADPEVRRQQQAARRAEAALYAKAIRSLREQHGLRQSDIPELTERQVRRLEEGDTMPRVATLQKLARAHSMDVDAYVAALAALSVPTKPAKASRAGRTPPKRSSTVASTPFTEPRPPRGRAGLGSKQPGVGRRKVRVGPHVRRIA